MYWNIIFLYMYHTSAIHFIIFIRFFSPICQSRVAPPPQVLDTFIPLLGLVTQLLPDLSREISLQNISRMKYVENWFFLKDFLGKFYDFLIFSIFPYLISISFLDEKPKTSAIIETEMFGLQFGPHGLVLDLVPLFNFLAFFQVSLDGR